MFERDSGSANADDVSTMLLGTGLFNAVHEFDCGKQIPTLTLLRVCANNEFYLKLNNVRKKSRRISVFVWSTTIFADATSLGNVVVRV